MKAIRKIISFLLTGICGLAFLIGCADQTNRLIAGYPYAKDSLEIKVKFNSAYRTEVGVNFSSKYTLGELKEQIDSQRKQGYTLETAMYGENYVLVDKIEDNIRRHYLLLYSSQPSQEVYRYEFITPVNTFYLEVEEGHYGEWLIPFHLLKPEETYVKKYFEMKIDRAYSTEYSIDEFYGFYSTVEEYTVSREENVISLQMTEGDGDKVGISMRFDETDSGTSVTYFDSVLIGTE